MVGWLETTTTTWLGLAFIPPTVSSVHPKIWRSMVRTVGWLETTTTTWPGLTIHPTDGVISPCQDLEVHGTDGWVETTTKTTTTTWLGHPSQGLGVHDTDGRLDTTTTWLGLAFIATDDATSISRFGGRRRERLVGDDDNNLAWPRPRPSITTDGIIHPSQDLVVVHGTDGWLETTTTT
ncbi:hypothetical protein ml_523 [Mollivirus sibericum]|nr:hypothetical protein ml_523 [Mollivirus sibericum]ALD62325.1 hypothetical protein ml_523 [Mollivirus sibericum]